MVTLFRTEIECPTMKIPKPEVATTAENGSTHNRKIKTPKTTKSSVIQSIKGMKIVLQIVEASLTLRNKSDELYFK